MQAHKGHEDHNAFLFLHVATTGFFAPAKAAHKGWLRMTVLREGAVSFRCAPPYETVILNGVCV
jgi:hypothetical protein